MLFLSQRLRYILLKICCIYLLNCFCLNVLHDGKVTLLHSSDTFWLDLVEKVHYHSPRPWATVMPCVWPSPTHCCTIQLCLWLLQTQSY